jgi:hypothetical protein
VKRMANLRRRTLVGVAQLLLPAALIGIGTTGMASAQTAPAYLPLFNAVTGVAQGGDITATPASGSTSVTIYLQNVVPSTTYTVTNCAVNQITATLGCTAGTPTTMTTDTTGNGTATFTFPTTAVRTISIVDPANSGDSYYAAVSGAPVPFGLNVLFGGLPQLSPTTPFIPAPIY